MLHRSRFTADYFQPIFEEVFGPRQRGAGLTSLLSEPIDLQMDQSATPNPAPVPIVPTPTTEPSSSTGAVRTGTESGLITPEEVSNITSSDAATVHSSDQVRQSMLVQYGTVQSLYDATLNFGRELSGKVLDSRPRGCEFEPHRRHCVVILEQDTFILA